MRNQQRSIGPQAGAPLSASDILANARALADRIRERNLAARYDELRNLPADIVAEVRDAGIMRMNMPKIWGGPEMTAMEQVEVIETLSRADASVGWCAFIWADSGIYSAYRKSVPSACSTPRGARARFGSVPTTSCARPPACRSASRRRPSTCAGACSPKARNAPRGGPPGTFPAYGAAVAEAHLTLGAARSYLFDSLERLWARLEKCEQPTVQERADAWLSRTNAFQAGRRVVALLYDTVGGSAIYSHRSPLDRHLRDINTACQHILGQTKMLEEAGGLLLADGAEHPLM